MIYPVHHIPGRLRIKNPAIKGNQGAADALRARICAIHGVGRIEVSTLTGSVVIEYCRETVTGLGILQQLDDMRYGLGQEVWVAQKPASGCDTVAEKLIGNVAQAVVGRSAAALVAALI